MKVLKMFACATMFFAATTVAAAAQGYSATLAFPVDNGDGRMPNYPAWAMPGAEVFAAEEALWPRQTYCHYNNLVPAGPNAAYVSCTTRLWEFAFDRDVFIGESTLVRSVQEVMVPEEQQNIFNE